jgi:ABC-type transporter Mla subunit MlaD
MQTLLIVAIVVIALAVITQAGVLAAMYLLSRKVTDKVQGLIDESQKLMAPLESITSDLKAVSNNLAQTGELAREQIVQIQGVIAETRTNIRTQLNDVCERVLNTVDEARETVMRPIRQYAAIANAVAEGIRTFFRGRKDEVEIQEIEIREEHPAA